jgi:RNA polymerase sigma factor (TIGR02999 family)
VFGDAAETPLLMDTESAGRSRHWHLKKSGRHYVDGYAAGAALAAGRSVLSSPSETMQTVRVASASSDAMMAALYGELHRLAQRERWRAGRPDTLQTTAVMHEAYLRLYKRDGWESREHFLGAAVTAMRHLLVDAARARLTAKRGGGEANLPLEVENLAAPADDATLVRLGDALADLARVDPKLAKVVDCRFFAGMSDAEAASVLGITDRTVQRWWVQARAWIHSELELAS